MLLKIYVNIVDLKKLHILILNKDLPNTIQLRQFEKEERNNRELTKNLYEIIKHMPKKSHPMDVARTAVSVMGLEDKETT